MNNNNITRRDFVNTAWMAAGALILTESLFVGLRFLSPRPSKGEFGGLFSLGQYDQYPAGSVTPVEAGRFFLVRLADGGFLAVYRRCTHLGCAVPYEPAVGQFICPCHGSAFSLDGDVLNAPASRPLDLFLLAISEDRELLVDTSTPIERSQTSTDDIFYV